MRKILFLPALLILANLSFAAQKDTIQIYNPTYTTDFEKSVFENYLTGKKVDAFLLSLCVDTGMNETLAKEYRYSLTNFLTTIRPEVEKIKKEKAKIQKIFKKAQFQFFNKYDIDSYGRRFYSDGVFNCVTGTTFFSLVLDSLNIPFCIKEDPTHTFLLAYPDKFSIPVESTDPSMMILIPDFNYKKNYVDFLVDSKLVSKADVQSKGVEEVFNTNYYSKTTIKPVELIGLLYYNSGTAYINENDYKKAFQQFEKAYILYPSERIRYALEISLLAFIGDKQKFTLDDLDYLAKLSSYSSNPAYDQDVLIEFNNYTVKYLINENNEEKYDKIYNSLVNAVKDSAVKSNISTLYYKERGRVCMLKHRVNEGWRILSEGYKFNPVDVELKAYFQNAFYDYIGKIIDDPEFLSKFENTLDEFNGLSEDPRILEIGARYLLNEVRENFIINNLSKAEKMLTRFENYVQKYPGYKLTDEAADAYANLSSAYFRERNIKMSNAILKRGLKLMPDNPILVRKYKVNVTHEIR